MTTLNTMASFPQGVLRPELFIGVVSSISAQMVGVNLSDAGNPSGTHYSGGRYGRGEVGEFVLIEGQRSILLGRIAEILLREKERRAIRRDFSGSSDLDILGRIQLLGCVAMDDLKVTAGVDAYPRLGDRIYAAPHQLIAALPELIDGAGSDSESVLLNLGVVGVAGESNVAARPERIFGRHCAILGATGGGKSWTTARIIEECCRYSAKVILIDATGEYRGFAGGGITNCHLGDPVKKAEGSKHCSLPTTVFLESDLIALFEPSGKVQGPKLRAALKSLRLAGLRPDLAPNGYIKKHHQPNDAITKAEADPCIAPLLEDPRQAVDLTKLVRQIEQECVYPSSGSKGTPDYTRWGAADEMNYSYCLSLITRINGVLTSPSFRCVFQDSQQPSLSAEIDAFLAGDDRLLRICLSGIAYEFHAREIIANVIGRRLLTVARNGDFQEKPTVVIVDEAHNFLGRHIGVEDYLTRLDAFELIAKEGRKYGLNVCLASQRPRDITDDVLSQIGTLIVHRLTNDRDRAVVERACGEIDQSASAFLPNLRPGEAVIIGTDFPIPLTVKIKEPANRPISDGPNYQKYWHSSG